ncbi:hypothetical protein ACYSNR_00695 [Enterococcus sp. LJL128]
MKNKTVLLVLHRATTLAVANQQYELKQGRLNLIEEELGAEGVSFKQ